jgi:hypothetical protein
VRPRNAGIAELHLRSRAPQQSASSAAGAWMMPGMNFATVRAKSWPHPNRSRGKPAGVEPHVLPARSLLAELLFLAEEHRERFFSDAPIDASRSLAAAFSGEGLLAAALPPDRAAALCSSYGRLLPEPSGGG